MSESTANNSHTVCWLPWLPSSGPMTVGNVTFRPFGGSHFLTGVCDELQAELLAVMRRFVDIHGQPVDVVTMAMWNDDASFPVLSDAERRRVAEAVDLLMLAYHANNDYFAHGQYVNASLFQLFVQNFQSGSDYTAVVTRRRDGSHRELGYERTEIKDQAPRAIRSCQNLAHPDAALLDALGQVHSGAEAAHRKVLNSLFYFALATTDDPVMPPSAEAVLLAWAIDHLVGPCNGREDYAGKAESYVATYLSVASQDSGRAAGGISKKAEEENWPILRQWAYEHYLLRNAVTHGHDWAAKQWRWELAEHCLYAAWLYPFLVKTVLAGIGGYALNENDEVCLGAADKLLAATDWPANWGSIFVDEKTERRILGRD